MGDGWCACLQTLESYSGSVNSGVTSSSQCLQILGGRGDSDHSVTFSHDSKLVASASYDRTVKVWDASSGRCLQTIEGHGGSVSSMTFSHDSKLLASASVDETVKLWDTSRISHVITVCYSITFLIALAFQCSPMSYNWNGWDREHERKCVKTNALVLAVAALNIVLDAWVIALPIPKVLYLQASITTKLQVVFMFSVAFLITGVSIYRTVMPKIFATITNLTYTLPAT